MDPIEIPYHLAIPTALCFMVLIYVFAQRKKLFKKKFNNSFWIATTTFLTLYILIVGGATFLDIYYQWNLNQYDLDKDGFFGGKEITTEQETAMARLTNDLGRNLSFITGGIFALICSIPVFAYCKTNNLKKEEEKSPF